MLKVTAAMRGESSVGQHHGVPMGLLAHDSFHREGGAATVQAPGVHGATAFPPSEAAAPRDGDGLQDPVTVQVGGNLFQD